MRIVREWGRCSMRHVCLMVLSFVLLLFLLSASIGLCQPVRDAAAPDTSSTVLASIRLGTGQDIAYCDGGERVVLRPGDVAVLACKGDSMTVNGRTVVVEPFPSPRICDLALLEYLFGNAPRVRSLLKEGSGGTRDSAAWRSAIARYCSEVHGSAPVRTDSLYGTAAPDARARSGAIQDLWDTLHLGNCHPLRVKARVRFDLAGVPIPGGPADEFCCTDARILAESLSDAVASRRPFHVEIGAGLIVWGGK